MIVLADISVHQSTSTVSSAFGLYTMPAKIAAICLASSSFTRYPNGHLLTRLI
nr:hypothetical protein [Bacillus pumilus]